ncbi:hypothetical protein EYR38_003173 [Pleurotus pulmonarius]|nr:hypothetical protein EYR38_003173 [Pleurotus pulmonarius]
MIGTAGSASLVPLLVVLFYLSTPSLRRQPIFIMNLLSVATGVAYGFVLAINVIRHPEQPFDTNAVIFVIAGALVLPLFIDVILAFRLYVVLPRRTTSILMLCVVFVPLAVFKVARLTNDVLFMIKFANILYKGGPATNLSAFEHVNPYHKIEWCLLVVDNCYASAFFLWRIGMGSRAVKSSGIVSHAKDTLTRLFYLGAASFVLPCMLGVGQLIFAFRGSGGYDGIYIFLVNVYVEIICSLVATLWAAQSRLSDQHIPKQSEASRISSFKVKSHLTNITNVETRNAVASQNASEDSIEESNSDIDTHRAKQILKDHEKDGLSSRSGNKWELNAI